MSEFAIASYKNFIKLTLITIAALSSTLGLRTELGIIIGDLFISTWISISWVFVIIAVISYYKAKQDVQLSKFIKHKENLHMLGISGDK